jgi:N,N-dimethylformamidase beta subunit-like, C-terminal
MGRTGASVRDIGSARRHRRRLRDQCRSGQQSGLLDGCRDALDHFIDDGENMALLSGNTCYWQVRIEDTRMVCCYKHGFLADPVQHRRATRDDDDLVGSDQPDHWLLEGTGLARFGLLGALSTTVGYECDGCDLTTRNGLPVATGAGVTPPDFAVVATHRRQALGAPVVAGAASRFSLPLSAPSTPA